MDLLHINGVTRGEEGDGGGCIDSEKRTSVEDVEIKYKWDVSRRKCSLAGIEPKVSIKRLEQNL